MKRFVLSLALVALLLCAPFMRSQDASTPTLRLTARDVYIPVWVVTRSDPNVGQVGVLGLQPADFHVHVDDVDIPVKTVAFHEERIWCVHEKTGSVREGSYLSFGIWTNPASGCMENEDRDDLLQRLRNSGLLRGPPWKSRWDIYTLSFNPPNSGTAGCHKVKVSVTTADTRVYGRDEFCDSSSPEDPLGGSKLGRELERDATSGKDGALRVSGQVGVFHAPNGKQLLDIALSFRWKDFTPFGKSRGIYIPGGIVALLCRPDGTVIQRISDPGPSEYLAGGSPDSESNYEIEQRLRYSASVERYERQTEVLPGDYILNLAIKNEWGFGTFVTPIHVAGPANEDFSAGDIFLCKRLHKPAQAPKEWEDRPASFIPLQSLGYEFTPAGTTQFKKDEQLLLWFQLTGPIPNQEAPAPIHFRVAVTEVATGKEEANSGVLDATAYRIPQTPIYAIAKQIGISRLKPGDYRIDLEAIDASGTAKARNSKIFTIAK